MLFLPQQSDTLENNNIYIRIIITTIKTDTLAYLSEEKRCQAL